MNEKKTTLTACEMRMVITALEYAREQVEDSGGDIDVFLVNGGNEVNLEMAKEAKLIEYMLRSMNCDEYDIKCINYSDEDVDYEDEWWVDKEWSMANHTPEDECECGDVRLTRQQAIDLGYIDADEELNEDGYEGFEIVDAYEEFKTAEVQEEFYEEFSQNMPCDNTGYCDFNCERYFDCNKPNKQEPK